MKGNDASSLYKFALGILIMGMGFMLMRFAAVDYELVGKHSKLIIDTRNVMANIEKPNARVLRA